MGLSNEAGLLVDCGDSTGSQTQCKKDYGINRECILTELPSILISRLFPHDWMHLCLENHRKTLFHFGKVHIKEWMKARRSTRYLIMSGL